MTFPFPINPFGSSAKSLGLPIWRILLNEGLPLEYVSKILQVFLNNNVWTGEEEKSLW